jgi:hypothetical protein
LEAQNLIKDENINVYLKNIESGKQSLEECKMEIENLKNTILILKSKNSEEIANNQIKDDFIKELEVY